MSALAYDALARGRRALAANHHDEALRWLDRAHRLVPHDANATLALASVCLESDAARAETLFGAVAAKHDVSQAWAGLAAARLRQANPAAAADALLPALARHVVTPEGAALADQLAPRAGYTGWCGLNSDGTLLIRTGARVQVRLDGRPLRGTRLPANWARCRAVEVVAGNHLLGSPISIAAIRALTGCIAAGTDGITGWAWHPGDPNTHPVLTVTDAAGRRIGTWIADDEAIEVPDTGPLARPRAIWIPAFCLEAAPGPYHVRGPNGMDLAGSPLDPAAWERARAAAALRIGALYPAAPGRRRLVADSAPGALPADVPPPRQAVGVNVRNRAVTVVIPVRDGGAAVPACLASVCADLQEDARVLVVDDGSRDPVIITLLDDLTRDGAVTLLRHDTPQGFPASANAGLRAARGHDVVLLNSDTLLPPRWLARLRTAAYADPAIGTVTPLSNEASILSYPGPAGTNQPPDQTRTNRLDRLATRANGDTVADIPVGVGFCLYIRRDCLDAVGVLRADMFAQGYGEETDFCLRARALGWRNIALPGLFVGHVGGQSFGAAARHLQTRNSQEIERLHPGYYALIDGFLAADPLFEARRRIDVLRFRDRGRVWRSAVILVTHDDGGGVERRLIESTNAHIAAGRRPVVLRPAQAPGGLPAIAVRDGLDDDLPNLMFRVDELPVLLRLLRGCRPERAEVHHLLGHHPAIYDMIARLDVPYDVHVHDYAWFCPRVVLVGTHGHYCGEPAVAECEACIADNGHYLAEEIGVSALRERSARFLGRARHVVVPSDDTGSRMRRHFPGLATCTVPHADDLATLRAVASVPRRRGPVRVGVVGGIGVHKGYDILLACARDAERRDLDLRFVVVGHTIDDARLIATGRVFITGKYLPQEVGLLIAEHQLQLGFIPSVCPETWCLALDELWRAGLTVAAFDLGAPAERIRRAGHGFLLPLGLSSGAINNALVAAARAPRQ